MATRRTGGQRIGSRPPSVEPAAEPASQQQPAELAGAGAALLAAARIQVPANHKNNAGVVYFIRIYATIVVGAVMGILGVEGWLGFAAYLVSQALCTLPILAKCGGNHARYLPSWDNAVLEHVFSSTAVLSYLLLWMVFYNICHVF